MSAFDTATQEAIDKVKAKPVDRFGNPIFCRSCTNKVGLGRMMHCSRWNTATESVCPFRHFKPELVEELEEA